MTYIHTSYNTFAALLLYIPCEHAYTFVIFSRQYIPCEHDYMLWVPYCCIFHMNMIIMFVRCALLLYIPHEHDYNVC